jgi:hypothetical protein
MASIPMHMLAVGIVFVGMAMSNLIDFDHLPAIISQKQWYSFRCIYEPTCPRNPESPNNYHVGFKRALFYYNSEVPLHNLLGIILSLTLLCTVYFVTHRPGPTLLALGILLGVIIHFFMDGIIKF